MEHVRRKGVFFGWRTTARQELSLQKPIGENRKMEPSGTWIIRVIFKNPFAEKFIWSVEVRGGEVTADPFETPVQVVAMFFHDYVKSTYFSMP